ncbi:hypothetical protein Fmac_014617 [Flemingia macrophylla]|uniref:Protein kinase domain-containing protein n=1 Tax=Flemingia macrophylla TaxID=520843 RepID=A0ABD1MCA4_9FABA
MDSDIVGSIDMIDEAIISFSRRVDNLIRSETASTLGESRLPSFNSGVDRAIRSRTPSSMSIGTSPLHTLWTPSSMSNFGTSLLHTFPRLFTLSELEAATDNFSLENKIGIGNSSVVYRGKLVDGGEVAIRRVGAWSKIKSPFNSESSILSRLPQHRHLVEVFGLCQEKGETFLVCEYMNNGSLYDNLHRKYSSVLNSWKMRIKIALDVSRGIQYLLDNTVPHVDKVIKSSNVLLDATWRAKLLSDFRMTLMKNTTGRVDCVHPMGKYANELKERKDVYGLGVVLLELITGKKPDFRHWGDSTLLSGMLGFQEHDNLRRFLAEDLIKTLDLKVGPPNVNEAKAVILVANTALRLMKTKNRPTMAHVALKLEQALTFCEW